MLRRQTAPKRMFYSIVFTAIIELLFQMALSVYYLDIYLQSKGRLNALFFSLIPAGNSLLNSISAVPQALLLPHIYEPLL